MGAFHDDAVLDLGVLDGDMVSDGCVGADAGCWADGAVVSDDGGASYGGPAVDEGAAAHPDVVRYGCGFFDGSVVIGVEFV